MSARAKLLELPPATQTLVGSGEIPVSAVETLLSIAAVSAPLVELVTEVIAEAAERGDALGAQIVRQPGWVIRQALQHQPGRVWAAALSQVYGSQLAELRLGKKTDKLLAEAEQLHAKLDRYAFGPPPIHFCESDADQARAAGVLLELDHAPLVLDRAVFRELAKTAVARTVDELQARVAAQVEEKSAERKASSSRPRTPLDELDSEHRADVREHTARAHGVNLDLGAALMTSLASIDPADMKVARFLAYGLLGPDRPNDLGTGEHAARTIAANSVRLVVDEHRTTETPTLKSGKPGKTKVTYGDTDAAVKWLWKWIDGAQNAGELCGRTLVAFACQHYAFQIALPTSQRRGSVLPQSHGDRARKAFEKVTKAALPGTHRDLTRASEREARAYREQAEALRSTTATTDDDNPLPEPVEDDGPYDLDELEADNVDALDEAA